MNQWKIGVLGIGGIGGFLAAQCERAKFSVVCVASPRSAAGLARTGIALTSASRGNYHAHPQVVERLTEPVDILFIAVKAFSLEEALGSIAPEAVQGALVIPLLNGIEHIDICRSRLSAAVAAGTISIEAFVEAPGRVIHASPHAKIELAADDAFLREKLVGVVQLLKAIKVDASIGITEAQVLWSKLARLNAIAATTTAVQQSIGFVRQDPEWRKLLMETLKEGIEVAAREGASIRFEEQMQLIDRLPEGLQTSLQRDVAAGRPTELEAIAGAVVRRGEVHGLSCPTTRSLIKIISSFLTRL